MNQVPPQPPSATAEFFQELRDLVPYLFHFVRHPIEGIKSTPSLNWPVLFTLQAVCAMLSGVLLALLNHSFLDFILGLIVLPLTTVLISLVFTFFILYFFSLFHHTHLDFRRLYTIVVLANTPYFLLHVFSGYIPPMDLLGFALTCILITVGIVEQFGQNRKSTLTLTSALYILFVVVWIAGQIHSGGKNEPSPAPKSLDELERDVR